MNLSQDFTWPEQELDSLFAPLRNPHGLAYGPQPPASRPIGSAMNMGCGGNKAHYLVDNASVDLSFAFHGR